MDRIAQSCGELLLPHPFPPMQLDAAAMPRQANAAATVEFGHQPVQYYAICRGIGNLGSERPGFGEGNEAPAAFVPELQSHASQAFAKGEALRFVQSGMVAQDLRQAVERNAALKVVQ